MKVRIAYTRSPLTMTTYRRAINRFYGRDGLATRQEVRRWIEAYGTSMDDDLAMTYDEPKED